ncbi:carbohydrate-binding protein [Streptomyces sp. AV19]|uniref:carbohydrate-binding protein n=1 Tax=Streptomyces sp. AV19 TaxID=2793068 RepID=UPI0018FEE487|nr:carbohydrate-binding protein [Streptomyces sp. AV19]MBH1936099.1 carbohydrate-binding protein [Streptomyces sp. AV19]MDG4534105.1 carbohydrate-binding protein [Streptomyces sp. AV19]
MTAGNNGGADGTGKPEEDDPFAHLYRSEGGAGGTQGGQAPQPGVPRTSYNQVRPVGSRQYNPQPSGGTYGAGIPPQHQPAPHYAAPETLPGGGAPARPAPPGSQPRPKRRGLLIAAIAVVLVVAGGIGTAIVLNQDNGDDKSTSLNADGSQSPSAEEKKKDEKKKDGDDKPTGKPVKDLQRDAGTLRLGGGATTSKDVKGAPSDGGTYVVMKPGASIEWNGVSVPSAGDYTVYVEYGAPGGDASGSLWINGKKLDTTVKLKSYGSTSWSYTYNYVQLNNGKNDIKLSCESGSCNANVARIKLLPGWYKS